MSAAAVEYVETNVGRSPGLDPAAVEYAETNTGAGPKHGQSVEYVETNVSLPLVPTPTATEYAESDVGTAVALSPDAVEYACNNTLDQVLATLALTLRVAQPALAAPLHYHNHLPLFQINLSAQVSGPKPAAINLVLPLPQLGLPSHEVARGTFGLVLPELLLSLRTTQPRRFRPPTREVFHRPDPRYRFGYHTTQGLSVVRIGGNLTVVSRPSQESLIGLSEGRDYFLGGHVYELTDAIADELIAAGYGNFVE